MREMRPEEMERAAGGSSVEEYIHTKAELEKSSDAPWIRSVVESFRKINDMAMCLDVLIRALQDHVNPQAVRDYVSELWN